MSEERPRCPDHPDRRPANARNVAKGKREYVCLTCGRVLGDAPDEGHGRWEAQAIGEARSLRDLPQTPWEAAQVILTRGAR